MGSRVGRKQGFVVVGAAVSVLCGYLAFRGIRWGDAYHALAGVDPIKLTGAFLFLAASVSLTARRWQLLVEEQRARWGGVLAALVVGLMVNNVLPARLGELARAIFLGIRADISKVYLMGTVVLDRLMDVAVLVSLALFLLVLAPVAPGVSLGMLVAGGVLLLAGVALVVLLRWRGMRHVLDRVGSRLPVRVRRWFAAVGPQLQLSLAKRRAWGNWSALVGLSLGVWFCMGVSLFLALQAFDISLPMWGTGVLLVVLNLGGLIPSSPGYIGTYHWLAVTTLGALGVDRSTGLSFALVNHALWYVPQVVAGLVILSRANLSVWTLTRRAKT